MTENYRRSANLAYAFEQRLQPPVTAGAYAAGDIMGGLLTFDIAPSGSAPFLLQEIGVAFKSAVTPSLMLVLFNDLPTETTLPDNAAYALDAADAFKVEAALPINALGGYLVDHGTPNTIRLGNLAIPMFPAAESRGLYGLLVDLTGVTLASTGDLQVTLKGLSA